MIENERPVKEFPEFRERAWLLAAILIGVFGVAGLPFVGISLFEQDAADLQKVERTFAIITPIATIVGAIVTFCTVVWRGMVSTRQANEQRRQNDAKDREQLAKLLVDGAGLLENEKQSTAIAGVAALRSVIAGTDIDFAVQAMDILAGFVERSIGRNENYQIVRASIDALNAGALLGRYSTRIVRVEGRDFDDEEAFPTIPINGVKAATYYDAHFQQFDINGFYDLNRVEFGRGCYFHGCKFPSNHPETWGARFVQCTFEPGTMTSQFLVNNKIEKCDFSGVAIHLPPDELNADPIFHALKDGRNYYASESPVRFMGNAADPAAIFDVD